MYVAKPWMINIKSDWLTLFTLSTKHVYYSNTFLSRDWPSIKPFYKTTILSNTRFTTCMQTWRRILKQSHTDKANTDIVLSQDTNEISSTNLVWVSYPCWVFGNFDPEESSFVNSNIDVLKTAILMLFLPDSGRSFKTGWGMYR